MLPAFMRNRLTGPLAVFLVLAGVLVAIQSVAVSSRRYLDSQYTAEAASPLDAYDAVLSTGVRARVLVLFDKTSRVKEDIDTHSVLASRTASAAGLGIAPDSITSALIQSGTARSAIIVVPDEDWAAISAVLEGIPDVRKIGVSYVSRLDASAVTYVRASDLRPGKERVVTLVNRDQSARYDPGLLAAFTDPSASDVAVSFETTGSW